ncbi:hypothetical protein QTP70_007154 [Hemibagrus guttatus]|uniref:Reverse transcriptase/retrotransposon-derived protein RNase H-like domain-containing protein n=1 Tax=Hemibagrus guttatus TaxID=175788 RepID=A0AAE0QD94_9TELE|nr:hypothetical protein QTP70_007154 [Hemibagrus guttatus]
MDQARTAFLQLKDRFTTAPILRHPDPELPFVVEVDASCNGIGAVLSQWHEEPGKLHPCAFHSRKLTAAERNYDVGYQELLAIKAALEEWRHWLEGARHPFQVLTDHLRGAKRMNPRQARWAPVLVALPGLGCRGVRACLPDMCAVADQLPSPGGTAGAPSDSQAPTRAHLWVDF